MPLKMSEERFDEFITMMHESYQSLKREKDEYKKLVSTLKNTINELEQKLEESKSTYEDDFKKEHPEFYDSNGCPIGF